MASLQGVATVAALVLVASGATKLASPAPARRALLAARLPAPRGAVLALGAVEVTLGAVGLVVAGPIVALALAATYVGFDLFLWRTFAVGGQEGCGCFGAESDVRPGAVHVALNLVLAAGCAGAATGDTSLVDLLVDRPADGAATALACTVAAFLAVVAYTRLPAALDLVRSPTPTRSHP